MTRTRLGRQPWSQVRGVEYAKADEEKEGKKRWQEGEKKTG